MFQLARQPRRVLGLRGDGYVWAKNRKKTLEETKVWYFWDPLRDFFLNFVRFSQSFSQNFWKLWPFGRETFDFRNFGTLSDFNFWSCTPLRDFWGMKKVNLIAHAYPSPVLPKCTPRAANRLADNGHFDIHDIYTVFPRLKVQSIEVFRNFPTLWKKNVRIA